MNSGSAAAGDGLAALSAGLARRLADKDAYRSNLVFSPLSIYSPLALVASGARGATLDELLRVLGVSSQSELAEFLPRAAALMRDRSGTGGPLVASACGVWSDLSCRLKPGFVESVSASGNTEMAAVDFRGDAEGARRRINAWAARVTHGLIDDVLGRNSVTKDTLIVLGNAVYFKGKWEQPFDEKRTAHEPFRQLGGDGEVEVPFMQSRERQYIAVHDGFKVLKLRYKMADRSCFPPFDFHDDPHHGDDRFSSGSLNKHGDHRANLSPSTAAPSSNSNKRSRTNSPPAAAPSNNNKKKRCGDDRAQFSMCIFLPDADDGLPSLINSIAARPGFLHDHLPRGRVDVGKFRVPRFKLSFHDSLVAVLRQLGLVLPFSTVADFSDMAEYPITLDEVLHKAVVEVNEEGTKAAAVTMVRGFGGRARGARPPPPPRVDFVADHPFAYFIVEEDTGAVVFAGYVIDPLREK